MFWLNMDWMLCDSDALLGIVLQLCNSMNAGGV